MVDKPRKPRRPAGPGITSGPRRPQAGNPGERPQRFARPPGKPVKAPVPSRPTAGVNEETLDLLEREGLLSDEGRKLRSGRPAGPAVRVKGLAAPAAKNVPARRPTRGGTAGPVGRPALAGPRGAARELNAAEALVAQRLHKVMAQAGVASRRHSEELIQAGRVSVNGKVVSELGTKILPGKDIIEVDGRPLGKPEHLVYVLLNKPKGYVTTLYDPEGRPKVLDLLGAEVAERVYPVGRLDFDTEGLLLLTNDGDLANTLMHPAKQIKKTYIAKVRGVPGPGKIKELESGVELDDGPTAPAEVSLIDVKGPNAATLSIRIHEGRNRQVRRMFEAVGHEVIHLKRTTLGPLNLKDLEIGQWRHLTEREIDELRLSVGLKTSRGRAAEAHASARPPARRGAGRLQTRGEGGARPARAGRDDRAPGKGRPVSRRPTRPTGPRPFADDEWDEAPSARPVRRTVNAGPLPAPVKTEARAPRAGRPAGARPGGARPGAARPGSARPGAGAPRSDRPDRGERPVRAGGGPGAGPKVGRPVPARKNRPSK